ncbi:MAG: hypothetical protein Q4C87_08305 [Actinomycetaceae bacterium]|nr:hypothetical protein [Actinomycetaceae bacterium]
MGTIAEHLEGLIRTAMTDGQIPGKVTFALVDGGMGNTGELSVHIHGHFRALISPMSISWGENTQSASFEYPAITSDISALLPTSDTVGVLHYAVTFVEEESDDFIHDEWMLHDDDVVATIIRLLTFEDTNKVSTPQLRLKKSMQQSPITAPPLALRPQLTIDLSGLQELGLDESLLETSAREAISLNPDSLTDTVFLDPNNADVDLIAEHWPRDPKGRLAPKTRVLLAAFGAALRQRRQPCLYIESARTLKEMPSFTIRASSEFRLNFHHNWRLHPQWWNRESAPPPADAVKTGHIARIRALMQAGALGKACDEAGVEIGENIPRKLQALPLFRGDEVNEEESDALHTLLWKLAPWKLHRALEIAETEFRIGRKGKLKADSVALKLAILPKQVGQQKGSIMLTPSSNGGPRIDFFYTADNNRLPTEWWQDFGPDEDAIWL